MNSQIQIAIISAGAALSGVIISQIGSFIFSVFDKKHKKQILLRQKYEELMFYFSKSFTWMKELDNSTTMEMVLSLSQSSDARNVLSLSLLYFPELVDGANQYIKGQCIYYESIVKHFDSNTQAPAGAQAMVKDIHHDEAQKEFFDSKILFENLIVQNAIKYTKA